MALAPWIAPAVLATYVHNIGIRLRREFRGHTRHPGDAAAIVRACIESCWNGRTFTASPGHFDMFWTRDLSFSVPSLVRLGHGARVTRSLAYALDVWARRRSHITTTIHYFDRPGDVFEYGVDSLPLFLAALRAADATDLVERHRPWLEARDRPLLRHGRRSGDRPGPFRPQVQRPSRHRHQPVECVRQHDGRPAGQDDRGDRLVRLAVRAPFRGRLRSPAGRSLLGGRPFPRRARRRDRLGRSQRLAVLCRGRHGPGPSSRPPCATSMSTASATRIRCATRRRGDPSARSG